MKGLQLSLIGLVAIPAICKPLDTNCHDAYFHPDNDHALHGCLKATKLQMAIGYGGNSGTYSICLQGVYSTHSALGHTRNPCGIEDGLTNCLFMCTPSPL